MRHTIKRKLSGSKGFSLAESIFAILILLLATSVATTGIPVAASIYRKVVDKANAQMLISTTMTVLRDELGTAKDVAVDGKRITYTTKGGGSVSICVVETGDDTSVYGVTKEAGDVRCLLVSRAAANNNMYTTYDGVTAENGVIEFKTLKAVKGGDELASIDTFDIRILTDAN